MKRNYKKTRKSSSYNRLKDRSSTDIARRRKPTQSRRRRKPTKKRNRFFMGRIWFLAVFIIGVIYLIGIVIDTSQKPVISYQMVQRGIIDNSDVFEGLVVRDEDVISNSKEGNMHLLAAEGERVRKNGQVYQILDASQSLALEEDIQDIKSSIEKVQVKRQDMSYYQNEIKEINNNIDTYVEAYHVQSKPGQLDEVHELKRQLEYELTKRQKVHMKDSTMALNSLKDQKEDLSSKLRSNEKVYKAQESGIISYQIDGFEKSFTPNNIDQISEKDINEKYTTMSTNSSQMIGKNEPAYRIVKDNKWKMVSFVPESWAEKFQVGGKYDFVLLENGNEKFSLKVEENTLEGDLCRLVFSSREQLGLFLNKRTVSFKSLEYQHEGLKIPTSAIVERNLIKIPTEYIIDSDEGKGVMVTSEESGGTTFLTLNIQYEDGDGFTHVFQNIGEKGHLKLGDTMIHPVNTATTYTVSQVSTTQGVYVINGRITKFKPVSIIAENDAYGIAKQNSIGGLKQFDQIVTNPKNIREEQLLRNMDVQNIK